MVDKPPLPPRQPRTTFESSPAPQQSLSPYSSDCFNDARASSQQSLHPVLLTNDDGTPRLGDDTSKRTVLLIYIHGFLGDETSFKSFPAHVHNLLSMLLADTHVVHSKIYPRYLSRKKIEVARDDFSRWLAPHESPRTDVVLLGHSLGGILAAEVILKKPAQPSSQFFQHKILGLVAFDSPFLGIHPSVIGTGIASLFRGTPTPPSDETSSSAAATEINNSASTPTSLPSNSSNNNTSDQTFNPAYANDVHLTPRRTGMLSRAFYFINKHWGSVNTAMCDYIDSHFEHGGVLADYPGLRRRYNALRALEDVNPFSTPSRCRVRFVNYYSASTGWIDDSSNNKQQSTDHIDHPDDDNASNPPSYSDLHPTTTSLHAEEDEHSNVDPTWVRVPMGNMDQVTAHTSMFSMSDAYAQLVGDTAARIEAWIREDEGTVAAIAAAEE
ncbi:hypothetical protein DV738_g2771, partial [Chaetothyriales sp. CBS 135597]